MVLLAAWSAMPANAHLRTFDCRASLIRMRITNLRTGDVYRLKAAKDDVYAQVGEGGDVGFFRARSIADMSSTRLALRVVMNEPSFRRHWKKEGILPLHDSLRDLARYGDCDIGSDTRYSVRLDNIDVRTVIDDATFESLERLAVWETAHVLTRLDAA